MSSLGSQAIKKKKIERGKVKEKDKQENNRCHKKEKGEKKNWEDMNKMRRWRER